MHYYSLLEISLVGHCIAKNQWQRLMKCTRIKLRPTHILDPQSLHRLSELAPAARVSYDV